MFVGVRSGLLAVLASGSFVPAYGACVGQQTGDLAAMEELAFRDPATALPRIADTLTGSSGMTNTRRAALHAIAADLSAL